MSSLLDSCLVGMVGPKLTPHVSELTKSLGETLQQPPFCKNGEDFA